MRALPKMETAGRMSASASVASTNSAIMPSTCQDSRALMAVARSLGIMALSLGVLGRVLRLLTMGSGVVSVYSVNGAPRPGWRRPVMAEGGRFGPVAGVARGRSPAGSAMAQSVSNFGARAPFDPACPRRTVRAVPA